MLHLKLNETTIGTMLATGQIGTLLSVLDQTEEGDEREDLGNESWTTERVFGNARVQTLHQKDGERLVDICSGRDIVSYRIRGNFISHMSYGTSAAAQIELLRTAKISDTLH